MFKLKLLGDLKYFLGLEIAKSSKEIYLCQRKCTLKLLIDTCFINAKPISLLMDHSVIFNDEDKPLLKDVSQYRGAISRFLYLTIYRPNISFAVNKLSQYMAKSWQPHLNRIHHKLQYLKGTPGQGIMFSSNPSLNISADSYEDWGSYFTTRKSTTRFCIFVGESLVAWRSKKQAIVSRLYVEAKYRVLASTTSELL